MLTATHIEGVMWLVGEEDETGALINPRKVAVRPGGTASDAVDVASQAATPADGEQLAADQQAARATAARAECSRRIFAVCDGIAQINLAAAAAAGLLSAGQMTVYRTGLAWVASMRAAWPTLAAGDAVITADENWPDVPAGVAELAAQF